MSGRFFSAPFLLMVIAIAHTTLSTRLSLGIILPLTALLWSLAFAGQDENQRIPLIPPFPNGIADERRVHQKIYSVSNYLAQQPTYLINPKRAITGDTRIEVMCHAAAGLREGAALHIIDVCGLADPLLARLPARRDREWRIGHFEREIPMGYLDSIRTQKNEIIDPATRNYYEAIKLVTQGPLFSWERMKMIWQLNFNHIPKPNPYFYQFGFYFQPLAKNEVLAFIKPGLTSRALGWQGNEDWGTWSDGYKSRFALPVPDGNPNALRLTLRALVGGGVACQQLFIDINGRRTTHVCLAQAENNVLVLPLTSSDRVTGKSLVIDFYMPSATSPKLIGLSAEDKRVLGVGLQTAVFE